MYFHHILFFTNLIHKLQRVNKIKVGSEECHRCTGRGDALGLEKRNALLPSHPTHHSPPQEIPHNGNATDNDTVFALAFKVVFSICNAVICPNCLPEATTIQSD